MASPDAFLEHFNKGVSLYKAGQADAAILEFRAAISLNPNVVQAHGNLAAVLTDQGRHDEAIAELKAAIQIDPKHAASLYSLGRYFEKRGGVPEALATFKAFLACAGPQHQHYIPDVHKRIATIERLSSAPPAPGTELLTFKFFMVSAERLLSAGEHAKAFQEMMKARGVTGFERAVEALDFQARVVLKGRRRRFRAAWARASLPGAKVPADALGLSPDGGMLASGHRDKIVRLWQAPDWREAKALQGHTGPVKAVCWAPDGKSVLSGSEDGTLRLWDAAKGDSLRPFFGHAGPVNAVCLTPDGNHALSAGDDKSLMLWDVGTAKRLHTLVGHDQPVLCATVTPDGRYALSGGADGALKVWELASGQALRTKSAHGGAVRSVCITPDGRILTAGDDGLLKEWDLESGACLKDWQGHSGPVMSVCLSPHGRFALFAGSDKALRTWDTTTGALAWAVEAHEGRVLRVEVSPDGRFVFSAGEDGVVNLWELDWDYEFPEPAAWDEGARPFLSAFLARHEADLPRLFQELERRGYGCLSYEGVKGKLGEMNAVPAFGPTPSSAIEPPKAAAPQPTARLATGSQPAGPPRPAAPTPMGQPMRPFKRLLSDAYGLWWLGRSIFAGVAGLCVALDLVLFAALLSAPNPGLRFIVRLLEGLLPAGAMLIAVVAADMFNRGLRPSLADVMSELEPRFLRAVGVVFIWLGGSILGLFFLIAPGVRIYIRLFFAPFIVLIDGYGGRAALERSWSLMRGREVTVLWNMMGFLAVTILCALPLQLAGGMLLEGIAGAAGASRVIAGASGALWALFVQVFGQAYSLSGLVLLYRDLSTSDPDSDAPPRR